MPPAPVHSHKPFITIAAVTGLVAASIVGYLMFFHQAATQVEPPRTDYGATLPPGFPSDIPTEQGAGLSQSYNLDYSGKNQLSVTFYSEKSLAENERFYTSVFSSNGWSITNKYSTSTIAALYAVRAGEEVNLTMSAMPSGSEINLSALVSSTTVADALLAGQAASTTSVNQAP